VVKRMPVVLKVVLENEKLVATDVVVVESEVVVEDDVVVVLYVVMVVARVTPRKFDAKSRISAAGQTSFVGATLQAMTLTR
jgi:hypothetical protein